MDTPIDSISKTRVNELPVAGNRNFCLIVWFFCLTFSLQTMSAGFLTESPPIAGVFLSMPQDLMPGIDSALRADLMRLYGEQHKAVRVNRALLGQVSVDRMTDDYIHLTSDSISCTELFFVPETERSFICIIRTVLMPIPDSQIFCYTRQWQPVSKPILSPQPQVPDFLRAAGKFLPKDFLPTLGSMMNPLFYTLSYDLPSRSLICRASIPNDPEIRIHYGGADSLSEQTAITYRFNPGIRSWVKTVAED